MDRRIQIKEEKKMTIEKVMEKTNKIVALMKDPATTPEMLIDIAFSLLIHEYESVPTDDGIFSDWCKDNDIHHHQPLQACSEDELWKEYARTMKMYRAITDYQLLIVDMYLTKKKESNKCE
jgi:hypothetical protein